MAFESFFWRNQIKRDIDYILKRLEINLAKLEDEKIDQVFSEVEIKFFTITYSLRKLMDTKKFPDCISEYEINVSEFPRNSKKYIKPWSSFDSYYDFKKLQKRKLSLRKICNQFIHAYFFQPVWNSRNNLGTILFVSDRDKEKHLYSINIKYLLRQIRRNIDKYPCSTSHIYNVKKGIYETTVK